MAHEIDLSTGRAAAFFAGQPAWHRLGTLVADCQTSEQAIDLAGLNWSVEKSPLFIQSAAGGLLPVAGHFACVRQDTGAALGVVGRDYRIFQNRQAFDFMDNIVGEKLAMFETAGALKGGRRVWMLARIPRELRVAKDDIVHPYVLLTNSHDGTSGVRIIPTSIRVVCQNTLNLALNRSDASQGMTIHHTQSLVGKVAAAREKLQIVVSRFDKFEEEAQMLANRSMSQKDLTEYFTGLVAGRSEKQQKKILESLLANFENERQSLEGVRGSAWAAYNAASEWADHEMRVLGKGDAQTEARLNSIWFGASHEFKQRAWKSALAVAV